MLLIDAGRYEKAFAAATEAARQEGMAPALRDPRSGVIETLPRVAGSILEPWRSDNASAGQALQNTIAYQRRRARFEFSAVGPPASSGAAADEFAGPDVPGLQPLPDDLSRHAGPLELRVLVFLERADTRGGADVRRSTWTRKRTTFTALDKRDDEVAASRPGYEWVPVVRDTAYERRLLAAVARAMEDALR